ncbi:hypothetical protein PTI98_007777 [Pleurotus ostreatus]|nr:hypothetical protein PTI98_007777 [Pleurotus ostreatus]
MSTWAVNEGILFAGLLVAAVLFGMTAIQASTFLLVHRKDPAGHKAVVILLMWVTWSPPNSIDLSSLPTVTDPV